MNLLKQMRYVSVQLAVENVFVVFVVDLKKKKMMRRRRMRKKRSYYAVSGFLSVCLCENLW
jgi:hypothetical protein